MQNCTRTISPETLLSPREMIAAGVRLFASGLSLWLVSLTDRLMDRLEARRNIAVLHKADDRMLKDIGLTRADVYRLEEASREHHR